MQTVGEEQLKWRKMQKDKKKEGKKSFPNSLQHHHRAVSENLSGTRDGQIGAPFSFIRDRVGG